MMKPVNGDEASESRSDEEAGAKASRGDEEASEDGVGVAHQLTGRIGLDSNLHLIPFHQAQYQSVGRLSGQGQGQDQGQGSRL